MCILYFSWIQFVDGFESREHNSCQKPKLAPQLSNTSSIPSNGSIKEDKGEEIKSGKDVPAIE